MTSLQKLNMQVRTLERQADCLLKERGGLSSGAEVTVDYFCLLALIRYFDGTKDAAKRVIAVRELLENVMLDV